MTRIEEIYSWALPEMKANNIEDTTANRISFLEGVRDAWKEDEDPSIEKLMYQLALESELLNLELKFQK